MTEALLTPNPHSRPGRRLGAVLAIVLHWYAHPGQSARGARQWWEDRKGGGNGYGSAHIAIDDREALLCVPLHEVAYHVGAETYTRFQQDALGAYPNGHTIGVELAHEDWTGRPSLTVWETALSVVAGLCDRFGVRESAIVTHWDVTGMRPHWNGVPCHRWFVEQPGELARFRHEVRGQRRR